MVVASVLKALLSAMRLWVVLVHTVCGTDKLFGLYRLTAHSYIAQWFLCVCFLMYKWVFLP